MALIKNTHTALTLCLCWHGRQTHAYQNTHTHTLLHLYFEDLHWHNSLKLLTLTLLPSPNPNLLPKTKTWPSNRPLKGSQTVRTRQNVLTWLSDGLKLKQVLTKLVEQVHTHRATADLHTLKLQSHINCSESDKVLDESLKESGQNTVDLPVGDSKLSPALTVLLFEVSALKELKRACYTQKSQEISKTARYNLIGWFYIIVS